MKLGTLEYALTLVPRAGESRTALIDVLNALAVDVDFADTECARYLIAHELTPRLLHRALTSTSAAVHWPRALGYARRVAFAECVPAQVVARMYFSEPMRVRLLAVPGGEGLEFLRTFDRANNDASRARVVLRASVAGIELPLELVHALDSPATLTLVVAGASWTALLVRKDATCTFESAEARALADADLLHAVYNVASGECTRASLRAAAHADEQVRKVLEAALPVLKATQPEPFSSI